MDRQRSFFSIHIPQCIMLNFIPIQIQSCGQFSAKSQRFFMCELSEHAEMSSARHVSIWQTRKRSICHFHENMISTPYTTALYLSHWMSNRQMVCYTTSVQCQRYPAFMSVLRWVIRSRIMSGLITEVIWKHPWNHKVAPYFNLTLNIRANFFNRN